MDMQNATPSRVTKILNLAGSAAASDGETINAIKNVADAARASGKLLGDFVADLGSDCDCANDDTREQERFEKTSRALDTIRNACDQQVEELRQKFAHELSKLRNQNIRLRRSLITRLRRRKDGSPHNFSLPNPPTPPAEEPNRASDLAEKPELLRASEHAGSTECLKSRDKRNSGLSKRQWKAFAAYSSLGLGKAVLARRMAAILGRIVTIAEVTMFALMRWSPESGQRYAMWEAPAPARPGASSKMHNPCKRLTRPCWGSGL